MSKMGNTVEVYVSDLIFDEKMNDYHREERTVEYQYDVDTKLDKMITDIVGDKPVLNNHIEGRAVQYIIRNNRVEWHVPTSDCTVDDYCQTYPDEEIEITIKGGIGAEFWEIIAFITAIVDYLIRIDWIREKISDLRIMQFCKNLIGKDGKLVSDNEFKSFILRNKEWRLSEFMQMCDFTDETLARCTLYGYGFECNEGDVFKYNPVLAHNNEVQIRNAPMRYIEKKENKDL